MQACGGTLAAVTPPSLVVVAQACAQIAPRLQGSASACSAEAADFPRTKLPTMPHVFRVHAGCSDQRTIFLYDSFPLRRQRCWLLCSFPSCTLGQVLLMPLALRDRSCNPTIRDGLNGEDLLHAHVACPLHGIVCCMHMSVALPACAQGSCPHSGAESSTDDILFAQGGSACSTGPWPGRSSPEPAS